MKATKILLSIIAGLIIFLACNCKKDALKEIPTLSTVSPTNITSTAVTCGGTIASDGNDAITVRGVCWNTNQSPTITDSKTSDGSGNGSFVSSITGLSPGTTYYLKAYATNSVGTAFGGLEVVKTVAVLSSITTNALSDITSTSLLTGGNISSDGGSLITARGVCWSKSQNPTIIDSKTSDGIGSGIYTSSITGLSPGTNYYIRSYATNSIGTVYGNQISTTTLAVLPSVTTITLSAITGTTATSGGNVTSDGGAAITSRGVCWSTTQSPTISNSKTSDGSGSGSFTSSITGLSPGTTYYFKAYATNSIGTTYGGLEIAKTATFLPIVATYSPSSVTSTSVFSGGSISNDGGSLITARGVCWSTNPNPTIADSKTSEGMGTGNFSSNITGLDCDKTYFLRAYATNNMGTNYGSAMTFTTLEGSVIAYYWENEWIKLVSWEPKFVGRELDIDIDAWNGPPQAPALHVKFDNLLAVGQNGGMVTTSLLSDDFNDGIINTSIWNHGVSPGATVVESNGVLDINIQEGMEAGVYNHVGGLRTKEHLLVANFDIQVDFEVNAEFHSTPNVALKLLLTDRNSNSFEIGVRRGMYEVNEIGTVWIDRATKSTLQNRGKLRLVRNQIK